MLALAVLGFSAAPALAAVTADERAFIIEAAQGGALEVNLGNLAMTRSSDRGVKAVASRIVRDHKMANQKLMALAKREGIMLPKGLSAEGMRTQQELMALKGAAFDRAYLSHMDEDHKHDIAAFEAQAKTAMNPQLKTFVAQTLPTLRAHEQLVTQRMQGGGAGHTMPRHDDMMNESMPSAMPSSMSSPMQP
jgi:putative membrane protein